MLKEISMYIKDKQDIKSMGRQIRLAFFIAAFFCCGLILSSSAVFSQSIAKSSNDRSKASSTVDHWKGAHVLPGKVVIKFNTTQGSSLNTHHSEKVQNQPAFQNLPGATLTPLLKRTLNTTRLKTKTLSKNQQRPLNDIYVLSYSSEEDPREVAARLSKEDGVAFAEPYFIRHVFIEEPNDPSYVDSWWLENIQALEAWGISTGDTSVTIAIVDTGVNWEHEDLNANIKINWEEIPDDGLDNDGNGYIDDYRGWDFGSQNNFPGTGGQGDANPSEVENYVHGSHCAGIASGATNNGLGIASIGYNTKVLPVKVTIDNAELGAIYYGYEGIVYAAEQGAQIISCSWGGEGFSHAEKAVIDYVTDELGALVLAAAGNFGNNNDEIPIYPAAYENVLSVGNVTLNDVKASTSNWGIKNCDIMAPGTNILSTGLLPDKYEYNSGTSMASPIAAGVAGLIKAIYPSYSPQQIIEQIKGSADNIDQENPQYAGRLGAGRLNAFRALSEQNPGIRLKNVVLKNINGTDVLSAGDTVILTTTLENVLYDAEQLNVDVSSESAAISFLNSQYQISSLNSGSKVSNSTLVFKISDGIQKNEVVPIILTVTANGGSYQTKTMFSTTLEKSVLTAQNSQNQISMSINGTGNIGYDDFPNNTIGEGFKFAGYDMLFEGALMIGTSSLTLNDVGRINGSSQAKDFENTGPILENVTQVGDVVLSTSFQDNGGSSDLGIAVNQHVYVSSTPPDTSYALISYWINNESQIDLTNLHVGLLMDWDVIEYANNESGYDENLKLLYSFHPSKNIYGGALPLEGNLHGHVVISDTITTISDVLKWTYISNGIMDTIAQGDIITFYGSGPFNLSAAESLQVGFAIVGGSGREALITNAQLAKLKWPEIKQKIVNPEPEPVAKTFKLSQNYPNPFNPRTTIQYSLPALDAKSVRVKLAVYDLLGRLVAVLVDKRQPQGNYSVTFDASRIASGMYFYRLQAGETTISKKMIFLK